MKCIECSSSLVLEIEDPEETEIGGWWYSCLNCGCGFA